MKNRMIAAQFRRLSVLGSIVAVSAAVFSCSSTKDNPGSAVGNSTGNSAQGGSMSTGAGPASSSTAGTLALVPNPDDSGNVSSGPCMGLACQVQSCAGSPKTTISGKVYDPAGKVPLYNVLVYVPNSPVLPFTEGAKCDRCDASVLNPVTAAVTDETGSFVLKDAPVGANVPLVMQVGKWRRQITIPAVAACADTPLTDPQVTRLPRNKSEGDIPRIAITTGASDQMECLPLRLGIDAAEFTTGTGDGRIHLYSGDYQAGGGNGFPGTGGAGAGGATGGGGVPFPGGGGARRPLLNFDATLNNGAMLTPADALWASKDNMMKYDILIMSCESDPFAAQKPAASRQALYDYASAGGRVFASHFHHIWFSEGPQPVPTTGTWQTRANPTMIGATTPITGTINQAFPKGAALAKWLLNVNASTTLGQMDIVFSRDNLQAVNPATSTEWISIDNPMVRQSPKAVEYMSFNTPIGAPEDQICGREVYTSLHVASVEDTTAVNAMGFPASCEKRDLSAQEKAVAFMLFDLSACVQSEDKPPMPPR